MYCHLCTVFTLAKLHGIIKLIVFVCSLFDREINNPNLLSAPRQHTVTPLSTARRAFEEKLTAFRNQLDMLGFAQSARIK